MRKVDLLLLYASQEYECGDSGVVDRVSCMYVGDISTCGLKIQRE